MAEVLQGLRILVVEDDSLIAMFLEEVLSTVGCDLVGPVARLAAAKVAARERAVDCAILDINLKGELVYPVAEILAERGIPFAFATGYGSAETGERFRGRPILHKPFKAAEVWAMVARLVA